MPLLKRILGETLWNMEHKRDMTEWMVWKSYPSGVEVLAYGGVV